ncbi:hypothetical protein RDWZM_002871 [Blomia tropicalis]|uniref:Leishmanolysin-like peptidase n=1 Tax=Blomia tropicalis TaxID=40697 RepID=A0A9Q0ME80_BLOTA|nr:hypothetical protein RDWZM_002871 [Blomia tropicalis]
MCHIFPLLLFTLLIGLVLSCGYIPPKPGEVQHAFIESGHSIHKREADHNLRIKYFYDEESLKRITIDKFRIINNTVLPEAINYWQQALFVKPFMAPIKLNRKCLNDRTLYSEFIHNGYQHFHPYCVDGCDEHTLCGEVVIPENHLEECRVCEMNGENCQTVPTNYSEVGIRDADFVFYISTMQTDRCNKGSTVAYAVHCQQETTFNRPIAGHANICPDSISTKPQDLDTLISTFKHEILHALGFSVSLYAFYRDFDGNTINSLNKHMGPYFISNGTRISQKILRRVTRDNWKVHKGEVAHKVYLITTPNVIKEVRDHFNCSKLEGAELENQGEDGTYLTHWEKRLFENEAMTGTHTQNPIFSRITLALMEDTGWYRANYSLAQPLEWGKNLGCDFAMKSCKEWIDLKRSQKQSIHPFCDKVKKDPLQTECTDNRDSVALCNLREYDEMLDKEFQNFDYIPNVRNETLGYYGGSVALADYCPYIQEFTWKLNDEIVRGSKCSFSENNPLPEKNFALEQYGPNSKCLNHNSEMWEERNCFEIRQWQHWGSGCYNYRCSDGLVHIIINNHTFTCFEENAEINIHLYYSNWLHKGTILCPKCSEFCENCESFNAETLNQMKSKFKMEKHNLKCSSILSSPSLPLTVIVIIFMFYINLFIWI